MGPSYVERAFRRVAAIDKTARLALNEAQCDNDHDWGQSIRPLLAGLVEQVTRRRRAPRHGRAAKPSPPAMAGRLFRLRPLRRGFAARGPDGLDHRIRCRRSSFARRYRRARPRRRRDRREFSRPVLAVPAVDMVVIGNCRTIIPGIARFPPARPDPCPSTTPMRPNPWRRRWRLLSPPRRRANPPALPRAINDQARRRPASLW